MVTCQSSLGKLGDREVIDVCIISKQEVVDSNPTRVTVHVDVFYLESTDYTMLNTLHDQCKGKIKSTVSVHVIDQINANPIVMTSYNVQDFQRLYKMFIVM